MTDKRIAKLLQGRSFKKELFLDGTDEALIMERIQSVAHLPLENIRLGVTATRIISDIHTSLENLSPHLKKLTLVGDRIGLKGARVIAILIQNGHLFKLCITFADPWACGGGGLFVMINSVKQSSVRNLKLHGLRIVEHVTAVIIDLIISSQIVELCLNNCTFDNALPKIINSISESNLQTLRLGKRSFSNEEIIALTASVKNSSLIKLCLSGDCGGVSRDVIRALTEAIQTSNIENLSLANNNIEAADIGACIEGSCVKKLKFMHCFGHVAGLIMIINGIKRSNAFESLIICDVALNDLCIDAICDLLENSCIKTIKLNGCGLRDEQLLALILSIKQSSLKSLGLKNNYIKSKGAQAICELLENYNLEKLDLDENALPHDIIKSMLPSIKRSVLVKLNVDTYRCSTDYGYKKIRMKIKKILRVQQQISRRCHKVKSANNI